MRSPHETDPQRKERGNPSSPDSDQQLDDALAADVVEGAPIHEALHALERPGNRLRDLVPAGVCIAVGLLINIGATQILARGGQSGDFGPSFWPQITGTICLIAGVVVLLQVLLLRNRPIEYPEPLTLRGTLSFFATIVILIAYAQSFRQLPFWVTTFVVSVGLLFLFGIRTWKGLLLFPAIVTAVLHFLFVVALRVPL